MFHWIFHVGKFRPHQWAWKSTHHCFAVAPKIFEKSWLWSNGSVVAWVCYGFCLEKPNFTLNRPSVELVEYTSTIVCHQYPQIFNWLDTVWDFPTLDMLHVFHDVSVHIYIISTNKFHVTTPVPFSSAWASPVPVASSCRGSSAAAPAPRTPTTGCPGPPRRGPAAAREPWDFAEGTFHGLLVSFSLKIFLTIILEKRIHP